MGWWVVNRAGYIGFVLQTVRLAPWSVQTTADLNIGSFKFKFFSPVHLTHRLCMFGLWVVRLARGLIIFLDPILYLNFYFYFNVNFILFVKKLIIFYSLVDPHADPFSPKVMWDKHGTPHIGL